MAPTILWLRRDLRLQDNPALFYAISLGNPIIPVFIYDERKENRPLGGASKWWLLHSLKNLEQRFLEYNSKLLYYRGIPSEILQNLAKRTNARAVAWNHCFDPEIFSQDKKIKEALITQGLEAKAFNANLFFEPGSIQTKQQTPYRIFTSFWKEARKHLLIGPPPPAPLNKAFGYNSSLENDSLELWNLYPPKANWADKFTETWEPGEEGALKKLDIFLEHHANGYSKKRDFLINGEGVTSLLSPHLCFGEISPRHIAARLQEAPIPAEDKEAFLRELGWREFSYNLLWEYPHLNTENLRPEYNLFPWGTNYEDSFSLWKKGQTGYPIVDAAMRQLWATGWIPNRVRMIVASFLVKDLLIPWQQGEAWFWDTLVDADQAINGTNWQWVAGSGVDAAPYFRIFNPTSQGEKFDPQGLYIKKWIPELNKIPLPYCHRPWEAPDSLLSRRDFTLGKDYPLPIVDHQAARIRALEAFKSLKPSG